MWELNKNLWQYQGMLQYLDNLFVTTTNQSKIVVGLKPCSEQVQYFAKVERQLS